MDRKGVKAHAAVMRRGVLALEAGLGLLLGALLVHGVPIHWTVRAFGGLVSATEGSCAFDEEDLKRARRVARRVQFVADRLPWHSTCLVRAVAGALLLRRRRILGATIRFGVRKTEGVLEAHAWLLLGREALLGGAGAPGYRPLADLGG